jgi:hypothetical protein
MAKHQLTTEKLIEISKFLSHQETRSWLSDEALANILTHQLCMATARSAQIQWLSALQAGGAGRCD